MPFGVFLAVGELVLPELTPSWTLVQHRTMFMLFMDLAVSLYTKEG